MTHTRAEYANYAQHRSQTVFSYLLNYRFDKCTFEGTAILQYQEYRFENLSQIPFASHCPYGRIGAKPCIMTIGGTRTPG